MGWRVACRKVKCDQLQRGHLCLGKSLPLSSFAHTTAWSAFLHNDDSSEDDYDDDRCDQLQRGHLSVDEERAVAAAMLSELTSDDDDNDDAPDDDCLNDFNSQKNASIRLKDSNSNVNSDNVP
eukprot:9235443-Karenia_brevis.AAC.1